VEIDRRRPAPAQAELSVANAFGAVTVRAWDCDEVAVRGRLAAGAEGFEFDGDREGTRIWVSVPEAWLHAAGEDAAFRSTLEILAPRGSRVDVETVNAAVLVEGFAGPVEVETVNGGVRVATAGREVEVETMTGAVEVRAQGASMDVRTVSGGVTLAGARGEVEVETVSGEVVVGGAEVASLRVETTTGGVAFHGAPARRGAIEIETFSGPVRLVLPKATRAAFRLQSFSGAIQSDFCAGTPVTRERFEPFRQLHCSTGPDDFEIHVDTHDADIQLVAE
jgi:hypothetical protein